MMKEDRVRLARIRSPQQNHIGIFDFTVRTGPATRSEYCRQTDDAGSVSSTVAAIDVVGPNHRAHKLLRGIVQLIGGLGAAEHAEGVWAVLLYLPLKTLDNAVQSFVPRGGAMNSIFPNQRLS